MHESDEAHWASLNLCRLFGGRLQSKKGLTKYYVLYSIMHKEVLSLDVQIKKGLLEYCVLSQLSRSESYGYQIMKDLADCIEISESTLYPILKRLEGSGDVETYKTEHQNRLRKYYRITERGRKRLEEFNQEQWRLLQVLEYIEGKNLK